MKKTVFFIPLVILLASCGTRYHVLSAEDIQWMPYNGHETLVFHSNNGKTDTIFFLKKDETVAYPEAQAVNGVTYQVQSIFAKHSDSIAGNVGRRYIEGPFVELRKTKTNKAKLIFLLSSKDATFYQADGTRIEDLKNRKPISIATEFGQFRDVYVIDSLDSSTYYQRDNFVSRIYWSKSQGLVRYDQKNGVYWDLVQKW